mmetsp:Transcript_25435/g.33211  ORF Transcript_25435/g.33211 Transcript_25435/m.33211 type:complete len:405 (+) Transcript_25435:76-1290(+)
MACKSACTQYSIMKIAFILMSLLNFGPSINAFSSDIHKVTQLSKEGLIPFKNEMRVCKRLMMKSRRTYRMQLDDQNDPMETSEQADSSTVDTWNPRSRQIVGLLGGIGAAECAYITYTKLVQPEAFTNSALCQIGGGGCGEVLTGPFSQLGSIPLTLPATLMYSAVAILALYPLFIKDRIEKLKAEESTRPLILVSGTILATFSTYLMMVLAFRLHTACPYCLLSAACSYSIAAIAYATRAVRNKLKATVLGVCTFLITALGSGFVYVSTEAGIVSVQTQTATASVIQGFEVEGPFSPPPITTSSSAQAIRLSERLKALDAKMYGAYWCSHCYDQKQAFGKEAYKNIKYIECSKKGVNSETDKCQIRDVPGYPTWEINGELYPGERSLDMLEKIVDEVTGSTSK